MTPQDFEELVEEFDLLALNDNLLHDPESAAEDPAHLESLLGGPVIWVPGSEPYGNLWRDLRVGAPAAAIKLCRLCFPPSS